MNIPEIVKQLISYITNIDFIICTIGALILGGWLLRTSLGRKALSNSELRRNNMPLYLPFVLLFIYFSAGSFVILIAEKFFSDRPAWQKALLDNFVLFASAITAIAVIIVLARVSFAQRLKGFGLNLTTIHKDIPAALLNLLTVYPLMTAMMLLTMHVSKIIFGPDFEIQPHKELELLSTYPQLSVRVLTIATAIVIVPVFEEMLFRGLFQTAIRSALERVPFSEKMQSKNARAWLSIIISSILFISVHANPLHWPTLFVLSLGLGYAYEKSGSLFRPIFIHSLFNATSVIAVLYQ